MDVPAHGERDTALGDLRVLDLAGEIGVYCAKLLADLGADVLRIEPPSGDPLRRHGPFVRDEPDPERSLYWLQMNTSKRSVTLDITAPAGQELFRRLVRRADVIVESTPPGYLDSLGLGYEALRQDNPRLIMTCITGFGRTGPYQHFKATDIVGVATGGMMHLCGFPEDPPCRPGAEQGYHCASLNAAVATLIAVCDRDVTGEGQHVDVSMQECIANTLEFTIALYAMTGAVRKRSGRGRREGILEIFPCKDGYIVCGPLGGGGAGAMLDWMDREGLAGDLKEEKWKRILAVINDPEKLQEYMYGSVEGFQEMSRNIAHITETWARFLLYHTRQELYEECQRRRVWLMPVQTAADLLTDPQLTARGYFVPVEHPELDMRIVYPGAPYRMAETPWRIRRRAPLPGEDNQAVYEGELGLSRNEIQSLRQRGVI